MRKTARANLENKKRIFLEIGFIVTLLMVFLAFEYRSYESRDILPPTRPPNTWVEEFTQITIQKPPEPKVEIIAPVIHVVLDTEAADEIPEFDASTDENTANTIEVDYVMVEEEPEPEDDRIYTPMEAKPEFPGGYTGLMQFLNNNLKYPAMARELGISGIVYVGFIIEKDGSVSQITLERGIGGGCDEEAMRVVRLMPKWKPGMQTGRNVKVAYYLPVKYTIQ